MDKTPSIFQSEFHFSSKGKHVEAFLLSDPYFPEWGDAAVRKIYSVWANDECYYIIRYPDGIIIDEIPEGVDKAIIKDPATEEIWTMDVDLFNKIYTCDNVNWRKSDG